ncbi:MAG: glycosyltransferase family 2 protein [Methylococcaceae bacterium]|nr:glycosyltransferase family 2 protein [Methylococcaceae bacterium]
MLVFITSLRHPQNSSDYRKVEHLLARTLNSVCAQTDNRFQVIVVCNQIPSDIPTFTNVHYVKVGFPAPSEANQARTGMSAVLKDKGTKYVISLKKAEEFNPEYVMFFDADDYLHKDIAGFVNTHPGENGWYVDKGFVYRDGGLLISETDHFNQVCGSSHILKFDLLRQPDAVTLNASQDSIMELIDHEFLFSVLGGHRKITAWFSERNLPLKAFPYAAAIWLTNTGENHSGVSFFGLPSILSAKIKADFNLRPPEGVGIWIKELFILYPFYCIKSLLRYFKHKLVK